MTVFSRAMKRRRPQRRADEWIPAALADCHLGDHAAIAALTPFAALAMIAATASGFDT